MAANSEFGYFADPTSLLELADDERIAYVSFCRDNRDVIVEKPVLFVDPMGRWWRVPVGYRSNGLSSGRLFWRIVMPYEEKSREGALIHDYLYENHTDIRGLTRKYADMVFYWAMRANGRGFVTSWVRWAGVRIGGWHAWRKHG